MIAPPMEDRLVTFRNQVDQFRADAEQSRNRLDALLRAAPLFDRTFSDTARIKAAIEELERSVQGLRNAERVLRIAESVWDADDDRPP